MARKITGILYVDDLLIPYEIKTERRASARYAIGRTKVNVKLPFYFTNSMIQGELKKIENWVYSCILNDPSLRTKFELKDYFYNNTIIVLGTTYTIQIEYVDRRSNTIKLYKDNILGIRLEQGLDPIQQNDLIKRLLSRVISKLYLPYIKEKVAHINHRFFKEEITQVRIKYNKSNWGSCSSKRNINLSSRLLLAPNEAIIDYVIIHELSHLKEMNHSPAFWKIVSDIMPNYKTHENWLKKHGHLLDF